jgi:predicted transcriptional regulator
MNRGSPATRQAIPDARGAEDEVDREADLSYIVVHMKSSSLTIRLDPDLDRLLTKASRRSGTNRSQVAREALRRQLRISQFERLRQHVMPFAEARGYLTDEDVFADVS